MTDHALIREFRSDEWDRYRQLRLESLRDSPGAFGRTWNEESQRPAIFWIERLTAASDSGSDLPLVAQQGASLVGLAWGRAQPSCPDIVQLFQMWVRPKQRGAGIGNALVCEVIRWARSINSREVQLGVAHGDSAAVRLYSRCGFVFHGEPSPIREGSPLLARSMRLKL